MGQEVANVLNGGERVQEEHDGRLGERGRRMGGVRGEVEESLKHVSN